MLEHLLIYGFATCWCALLGGLLYWNKRTQYNPVTLLCLVWAAGYSFTLVGGYGYRVYWAPNLLLLILVTIPAMVAIPCSGLAFQQRRIEPRFATAWLPRLVVFSLIITLLATLYQWRSAGLSLSGLLQGGTDVAADYTHLRYQGKVSTVGVVSLAMALCNAVALLVGARIGSDEMPSKYRLPCVAGVCVSLLPFAFVSTSRLQLFGIAFNLMGGWLAGFVLKIGGVTRGFDLERRFLRTAIIATLVLTTMTVGFQMVRSQAKLSQMPAVLAHLRPWLSGYVPGFGIWYHRTGGQRSMRSAGDSHLLAGAAGLIGLEGQPAGRRQVVMLDSRYDATTNALTLFRDILPDTGTFGALLLMAALASLMTLCYTAVTRGSPTLVIPLACCYTFVLWSVNKYQFAYGSQILGCLLACGYGWISNRGHVRIVAPHGIELGSDEGQENQPARTVS